MGDGGRGQTIMPYLLHHPEIMYQVNTKKRGRHTFVRPLSLRDVNEAWRRHGDHRVTLLAPDMSPRFEGIGRVSLLAIVACFRWLCSRWCFQEERLVVPATAGSTGRRRSAQVQQANGTQIAFRKNILAALVSCMYKTVTHSSPGSLQPRQLNRT